MDSKINQKVVAWAHGKLRQQIGKGECWDLLDQALRFAGARSSTTTGPDDDYVWGTPIKLEDVVPGDILQLRNSIITTKTETLVRFPDGKGYRDTDEVFARRPHHGAIVEQVRGAGVFRVLEQHVKPLGNRVQVHIIATRNAPPVTQVTHKTMKDARGKMVLATVTTTVTVTVVGSV